MAGDDHERRADRAARGRRDSDPVSRRFVELVLGRDGEFVVEAAASAAAAILRVQTVEIIIADTDLADTNGLQFSPDSW